MSDLYERISSSRNRWYSWLEAFLNVYTCYLKARFIACKKTRCVHIYPSTRTSCKITLHFFTLADEGFTVFTVANARCAVYHAIPVLSILLFGPAVIYPAVAWNGRPGGGDGVYFRLHVSNPVLSRFFFRLPRVNRAKTQDLSLSSSRSTPFLPPPTLSRFNFFLSFHAIASFVLFFFVASTNLRRILVSAFLAVFPLCFQPFSLRRKPSCSTTTWPSAFASASVFLHPFRARFSRNYFYPRLWCKFLLFSIPPRPLPYSLSQPLLCLCPISTIPASSFSFVRLPLSPTSPLDRPSPFSP